MSADAEKRSFPPSADASARVLILGSMPGEESLRQRQYYAFKRNAFWRIMEELFAFDPALEYEERLARLRAGGVALWDVLASCRRRGSLDTAITAARPNDIAGLLRRCPKIAAIGCNGTAAFTLLRRFQPELRERAGLTIVRLPSTSPAAAGIAYAAKRDAFRRFLECAGAGVTPLSPGDPRDR